MLAWEQFAALAFLLHLARTVHVPLLICDIVQALFHIRWMLVVWFMALLIAAEIMRLPDTTTTNLLSSLVQLINSISPPSFDPNTEPLIWNHVALVSALEFICLLTFSVFCGALIAQLTQRGEWRRRQKRACLMCLKDKSLLESKHGSF